LEDLVQDTIERSIDIAAPVERVWGLVTEPGWWVPTDSPVDAGDAALTPGHVVVRESQQWGRFPVQVVELRPMTYAAFRWAPAFPGEDLAPGRTTLIEFTVTPTEDGARVSVVESGISQLEGDEALKAGVIESNSDGWTSQLSALRGQAQA
jgi:uncharacterized protein YndB with AHSA1/START domain